jgi:hypothetical protein
MHFATRVRTWRVARLYSEIALSRKPFGIGHMYTYSFLFRMTDVMTFRNIDLSFWDRIWKLSNSQWKLWYSEVTPSTAGSYPFPSRLKGGPNSKQIKVLKRNVWSWIPKGIKPKNQCASKSQQQFNWPTKWKLISGYHSNETSSVETLHEGSYGAGLGGKGIVSCNKE